MSAASVTRRARGCYLAEVAPLDGEDRDFDAFPTLAKAQAWCNDAEPGLAWRQTGPDSWYATSEGGTD